MPQLFTLLSTVPQMKVRTRSLRAEMGRRQLRLNSSVKAAVLGCTSTRGSRSQKRRVRAESVTELQFRKAIFLVSAFCLNNVRRFSKRLKKTKTVACCYETYRMWREGKVESPSQFMYCHDTPQKTRTERERRGRQEGPAAMLV